MEIVTSWQQEGELKVILRMLNRKLGSITPQLEERIREHPSFSNAHRREIPGAIKTKPADRGYRSLASVGRLRLYSDTLPGY